MTETQSHQVAFKLISVGVAWELPTSCIISCVVGVQCGFFFSVLMQSLPGAIG